MRSIETMKAVVVRGRMEFAVEEVPRPTCDPEGLLLKVQACGLCGGDLRTLRHGHQRVTFPWILGHEIAGTVFETGAAYHGPHRAGDWLVVGPLAYNPEDEFCANGQHELCSDYREIAQHWPGGFAEYMAIPPECLRLGTIQPLPTGMDPAVGAISEPICSCINAQEKGCVGLGDTVVVIGAGSVGCIHLCLARARGAHVVIMADLEEERLALCRALAPDHLINTSQANLVGEVRRLTRGRGADVIITANAASATQVQAVEMARKGGRILLFAGVPKDQSRPGLDTNLIHYQALQLIGTTIFAPRHQRLALQLLASGRIPGEKLVTDRWPLTEFSQGVAKAMAGRSIKTVFQCDLNAC
jgi:L-iditol 2-dehydrogenase